MSKTGIGPGEPLNFKPIEIEITGSFEEGMRRFKNIVQAEGVLNTLRLKSRYEKPSERKRRKKLEAIQRFRIQQIKLEQILSGEFEKIQKRKEKKKQEKLGKQNGK